MKFRFEKSMRIVSDLVSYCHKLGSSDYHIDMRMRKTRSVYVISAPVPRMTEKELKRLDDTLNTPRQHEVEQNYWILSGESETDPELTLVGMMIDKAKVDLHDGVLTIIATRLEGPQ